MERVKEVMGLGHKGEEVEGRTHTGAEGGLYPTTGTTGTHTGTTRTSHETGGMYETTPPATTQDYTYTTTTGTESMEGRAAVCGQEFFTRTEDRPVVIERVERIVEHRPVEKEFVVETRATGVERHLGTTEVEHLGTTERIVSEAAPKAPCE